MEALSFTVLVAHGGVGVAAAGCGRSSSSLLFLRCFFSLFLLFPFLLFVSFVPSVNNVLPSLQRLRGGAGGGGLGNGLDGGRPFFLFFYVFFLLLCSPLFLFPSSVSHGTVGDWEDSGSWW
jgi:hypothetical protein